MKQKNEVHAASLFTAIDMDWVSPKLSAHCAFFFSLNFLCSVLAVVFSLDFYFFFSEYSELFISLSDFSSTFSWYQQIHVQLTETYCFPTFIDELKNYLEKKACRSCHVSDVLFGVCFLFCCGFSM